MRYKNRLEIVSKTASLLEALKHDTKNDIFPISARLGFQTGSNMAPQNCPKIEPKPDKSSTNLYKAYKTFPKWLRSSKNIQRYAKIFQKAVNMEANVSFHMVYATSEEAFVTDSGNRRMLQAFRPGANTDCILDNSDSALVGMYCTTRSEGPPCFLVSV